MAVTDTTSQFDMYSGDNETIRLTITDTTTGNPLDLDTLNAINFKASGPGAIFKKTLGSGVTKLAPAIDGVIDIAIDQADTEDVRGLFNYEVETISTSNYKQTVKNSLFTVLEDLEDGS